MDRVGMNFYNSGVSGTLTGLGILGTFLGLSMGMGAFSGDDIFTISDNVGSLLSGMKVAFHTSVYGILFSLVFNVVYRSTMADAYEVLGEFLSVFRQTAQPCAAKENDSTATMLIYQAGMANSLKQMLDLMKGDAAQQTAGVEHIVDKFTEQMQSALDADFKKLGNTLKNAGESQAASAANAAEMVEAVTALVEVNRNVQEALAKVMERQELFARQLLFEIAPAQKQIHVLGVLFDKVPAVGNISAVGISPLGQDDTGRIGEGERVGRYVERGQLPAVL